MSLSKESIKLVDSLIGLARRKGYRDETIEILIMLPFAVRVVENVGSTDEAMRKIIEFIKESETSQECIGKALRLAGIE